MFRFMNCLLCQLVLIMLVQAELCMTLRFVVGADALSEQYDLNFEVIMFCYFL